MSQSVALVLGRRAAGTGTLLLRQQILCRRRQISSVHVVSAVKSSVSELGDRTLPVERTLRRRNDIKSILTV